MNPIDNILSNPLNQLLAHRKLSKQSTHTDTVVSNFANVLNATQDADQTSQTPFVSTVSQTASSGKPHLLTVGSGDINVGKPNIKQFMDATGADFKTASDVLYGTIGSNTDLRDWQAIMASSTPLADARASTAAMYDQASSHSPVKYPLDVSKVLAQSGHLAIMDTTSNAPKAKLTQSLIMTDGLGNQLTSFGNAEDLLARASNFGFDGAADLSNLANSVSAGASIPAPDVNANPAARWDFILSVMQEQLKHRHHSGRTDELINQ